jgi:hypothetical protein
MTYEYKCPECGSADKFLEVVVNVTVAYIDHNMRQVNTRHQLDISKETTSTTPTKALPTATECNVGRRQWGIFRSAAIGRRNEHHLQVPELWFG